MANYNNLTDKLNWLLSIVLSLFCVVLLLASFTDLVNSIIFPSVPRKGILFVLQGWLNIGLGVSVVGFIGFITLLILRLFKSYLLFLPYDISSVSGLEDINKVKIKQIIRRVIYPMFVGLTGAIIPPIFQGWSIYDGVLLIVDKRNVLNIPEEREALLSFIPIVGEFSLVEFFLGAPTVGAKFLLVILSACMFISFWNLSHISQLYWSDIIRNNKLNPSISFTMKWLFLIAITTYIVRILLHDLLRYGI